MNYIKYLPRTDEYTSYNIQEKISEIIAQAITVDEIKNKIDAFPDVVNIRFFKNSIQLLHEKGLLSEENLLLIARKQNFNGSFFINSVLKILDEVKLINQENLESILKGEPNNLYFNISILHKNSQLTAKNLQALADEENSYELGFCFNKLFYPPVKEEIPQRFQISFNKLFLSCSNTFFKFGVNPFIACLPSKLGGLDSNCPLNVNNNLFLANFLVNVITNSIFKKSIPGVKKNMPNYTSINEKLDRIENMLKASTQTYSNKELTEDTLTSSNYTTRGYGL